MTTQGIIAVGTLLVIVCTVAWVGFMLIDDHRQPTSKKTTAEWVESYRDRHRWEALARYKSERDRGIVHTPAWDRFMEAEQRAFDFIHGRQS